MIRATAVESAQIQGLQNIDVRPDRRLATLIGAAFPCPPPPPVLTAPRGGVLDPTANKKDAFVDNPLISITIGGGVVLHNTAFLNGFADFYSNRITNLRGFQRFSKCDIIKR
ncbi:MAG: hypothetical protein LBG05_05190 [Treponema sp.]|nr:hypothetical protein [Treponema sp.]